MPISMISYPSDKQSCTTESALTLDKAAQIRDFHRTLPEYKKTPLVSLPALAEKLGIRSVYVKDESYRFGLNAFKGLGGSYALAILLSEKTGLPMSSLDKLPENAFTFVTATDGNHGRGVAWAAKKLRQRAVVYMPKGSAAERLANIRALGAHAEITKWNYDDTVRYAKAQGEKYNWILVQDTAWPGYEDIPLSIMQGYTTMGLEIFEQLENTTPTHVFLQAGVGAMAGAITGLFANCYPNNMPVMSYVEPVNAACLYKTAVANDGALHAVTGDLNSEMAGLCCGEVCSLAWNILSHRGDFFFTCTDDITETGMRLLGRPLPGDQSIVSGESGAVTIGLVNALMTDDGLRTLRDSLGLNRDSVVLCISTEGDTDRDNYQRILR